MSVHRSVNLALVGSPNCGKTSLYNALTGHRQKVANYAGVTVERRIGRFSLGKGLPVDVVDLPGIYSLNPESPDQKIARAVIFGERDDQAAPDVLLYVIDSTKLRESLRFALELKAIGRPLIVALNMMDLAQRDGMEIDIQTLSEALGVPVIPTVAVRRKGVELLREKLADILPSLLGGEPVTLNEQANDNDVKAMQKRAKVIASQAILKSGIYQGVSRTIDSVVLHPFAGVFILMAVMFFMFQAVFSWAQAPMDMIDSGVVALQGLAAAHIPGGFVQSLIVDGVLAGVGSVVIFLPQILILFFFIMLLEQSGYMARAAFLMDHVMNRVGLSGHAFIPLLSSFACAIPGIMAARTIDNPRDRLITIMIAPLMTCSARLPVYTLIIAAFIPPTSIYGANLQGLVMFGLYLSGVLSALIVAAVVNKIGGRGRARWFLMELPRYRMPSVKNIALGLWDRARIFVRRAGTVILSSSILLWLFASYPKPPVEGSDQPDIFYSAAGVLGHWLEVIFAPIGFGWDICIALIPGMAAREVAVSSLGTVYALQGSDDHVAQSLATTLHGAWSLPTALAFLAWYVFAPQCISTLAVVRRETNGWFWPSVMFGYLFALAYIASGLTYHITAYLLAH